MDGNAIHNVQQLERAFLLTDESRRTSGGSLRSGCGGNISGKRGGACE